MPVSFNELRNVGGISDIVWDKNKNICYTLHKLIVEVAEGKPAKDSFDCKLILDACSNEEKNNVLKLSVFSKVSESDMEISKPEDNLQNYLQRYSPHGDAFFINNRHLTLKDSSDFPLFRAMGKLVNKVISQKGKFTTSREYINNIFINDLLKDTRGTHFKILREQAYNPENLTLTAKKIGEGIQNAMNRLMGVQQ